MSEAEQQAGAQDGNDDARAKLAEYGCDAFLQESAKECFLCHAGEEEVGGKKNGGEGRQFRLEVQVLHEDSRNQHGRSGDKDDHRNFAPDFFPFSGRGCAVAEPGEQNQSGCPFVKIRILHEGGCIRGEPDARQKHRVVEPGQKMQGKCQGGQRRKDAEHGVLYLACLWLASQEGGRLFQLPAGEARLRSLIMRVIRMGLP